MTRKLKKVSTSGRDCSASWSNLNHDLLYIIIMQMGVFDFVAFSGVCKSWRSLAVANWNKFMVSRQPMYLSISTRLNIKDCYLEEDYKRRKLKTNIPHSDGLKFVGITCGYLIFFGKKTGDFWLVNPFTRKQLYFPGFPFAKTTNLYDLKGILIFSPSMSGLVFVVLSDHREICFSLADQHVIWRSYSPNFSLLDLHFFKGKIYMISAYNYLWELRLHPDPGLTLLNVNNNSSSHFIVPEFLSSCENLYVRDVIGGAFKTTEFDFDEMKWVNAKGTIGEYAVFVSDFKCVDAIKPDTWTYHWTRCERFNRLQSKKWGSCKTRKMWYFPHACVIDNHSDTENGALLNVLEE